MLFLVPVLLSCGIIEQILPLHNSDNLSYLQDNWVQAFFHVQPLGVYHACYIHAPNLLTRGTVSYSIEV